MRVGAADAAPRAGLRGAARLACRFRGRLLQRGVGALALPPRHALPGRRPPRPHCLRVRRHRRQRRDPGPGRVYREYHLEDYSGWLRQRITDPRYWKAAMACVVGSRTCAKIANWTPLDYLQRDLSPIQVALCLFTKINKYIFFNLQNLGLMLCFNFVYKLPFAKINYYLYLVKSLLFYINPITLTSSFRIKDSAYVILL